MKDSSQECVEAHDIFLYNEFEVILNRVLKHSLV